jgi:hypothetical protein
LAVPAGAADTASVEAVKELPARGVQKPPCGVGEKRFPGIFSTAPAAMVEIPVGLTPSPPPLILPLDPTCTCDTIFKQAADSIGTSEFFLVRYTVSMYI